MRFPSNPDSLTLYINQLVWAPPSPPQGNIRHYNIRITTPSSSSSSSSSNSSSEVLALVEEVRDTFFDVRPYVLSDGDYMVEVKLNSFLTWSYLM